MNFLFWLYLFGIIVASMQDLKRREVDNWLNLFLGASGFIFVLYKSLFENNLELLLYALVAFTIMFVVMNLFYYGRVFAGGDAKLLLALSPMFVVIGIFPLLKNIGIFLFLLMLSGSLYGLLYSLILYIKGRKKANKEMRTLFRSRKFVKILLFIGILIAAFSIILRLLNYDLWFLGILIGGLIFLFPLLYIFSKSLEKVSMVRILSGNKLREGDWLVDDVKVGSKIIKANWEGLTKDNLKLLRGKKRVKIKEGLPFVPAFLIAFFLYYFLKDFIISFLNIF